MILEAEADLVPMGPRSPLRFGRCRADVPPDVLQPIFRKASVVAGQAPMVQGLASGSVGSWHEVPRTSLGLRSASVVAEQTSPGRLATHLPQGFGCCVAGAPWVQGLRFASVGAEQTSPGCLVTHLPHSIFRVKMG